MWKKENLRKNFLRVKQIADQNLGRVEKSEVLSEEFQSVEKRVENVKTVSSTIGKKLSSTLKAQQGDVEKRLKKLPETSLGYSLIEAAGILGTETLLGLVCQICGECQSKLAREQLQYEINVEREVLTPLLGVQEADIPAINKVRKQLTKSTLDMDSAKNRLNAAVRQSHVPGTNISSAAAKADTIKDEYEDAMNKVEQVKDCLAIELSNFVAKETDHSTRLLELLQSQAEYHKKALEYIEEVIPRMKTSIDNYPNKPVYGTSLVEHLRVTGRDIALVFEACIVTLLETGMEEEGLFRIAGAAIKLKKLKAVFDAHLIDMEEFVTEPHVIAGALKQYMRELPEPLLTYSLYTDFMQAATLPHDQRLQALWTVVSKMPKPNYDNFRYLVKFLAKLAEKSDVNKMTPSNIAIVIGPNLLWSEGESAPNMLTTGTLSSIIEAFVMHADYFFPGDLDFHLTSRGSQPSHLKLQSGIDVGAFPKLNVVAPACVSHSEAMTSTIVANHSECKTLLQLTETCGQMAQDKSESARPSVEGDGANVAARLSQGDRTLASKGRINSSSTLTTTNPLLGSNQSDVLYNARSSSVPPTPVTKSFHSDVYSTVFALQSLGDGAWNDYLTKVRAMWDGQYTQHPASPRPTDLAGASSGVAGGQPSHRGQELDFTNTGGLPLQATSPQQRFGNAVAPSAGPPSPGGQGETIQLLPSPTTAPQGSSLLGGSSPQGGGNGSNASSTSSLTATSAESPELGSSPKVQRRVSRKPAPPPPYAVAVTATYNNRNSQSQTQSQTWPRNAPLASPESPSESDKEDNERVRPCPPEKPPPPHQLHPHPERPTGPPPDRPAGPPPERPKAPPPVVPPGHQRSASTGAMFTVVGMPGAANGQGTGTLFSSQESLEKDSGSTLTEQGITPLLSPSSDKHATSNSHIKSGSSQNMRVTRPTPPPPPPPINKATEETHL
ncbi:rho GTPase-activating protein 44-like isoform X2 [Haliotis rufescens]|uniref:rho GTPase-activating protein 44-like isoform X2 n=1 Tax=Haliotis rufescens TaxID=6454 RepID=UPI00201EEFBC|nr:rho GTPase-activating protein 44-like isoform X2 [Haliotis rufescens]